MQFDALILDVDGTLWNSTGIVAKAWTKAVREGGGSRGDYGRNASGAIRQDNEGDSG